MKKVTENAVKHLKNLRELRYSNTTVTVGRGFSTMSLHGNEIASYYRSSFKDDNKLIISDAGWRTNTTKERLNWILREFDLGYIHQKNREWFFTNKDWVTTKREWKMEFDGLKN